MRFKFWIVLLVLFSTFNVFSQEKFIQHIVAKGENISKIAEHYKINATAIYELNPDAKKGIKFKDVLLIPVSTTSQKNQKNISKTNESVVAEAKQGQHQVLAKETVYGIAKQYGVKVTDLYAINPTLENKALKVGDVVNVPILETKTEVLEKPKNEIVKSAVDVADKPEVKLEANLDSKNITSEVTADRKDIQKLEQISSNGNIVREVLAKETLYGIAKQYGVTVADIEKANPILAVQALRVGQSIVIPTAKAALTQESQIEANTHIKKDELPQSNVKGATVVESKINVPDNTTETDSEVEVVHEVLAKETKYGIAKAFGLTVKELEKQNPKIVNRLLVGEKLTIRTAKSNVKTPAKFDFKDDTFEGDEGLSFNVKSYKGGDLIDQLICTASENIGVRYRPGGTSKDGFDCSGLMYSTFGLFDIQLPRSSFEQAQYGTKINTQDVKKGDLIFFRTNGRRQINHVGMVVEVADDGEIKFIHASTSSGVIISSLKEEYYSKRVTQINRVL